MFYIPSFLEYILVDFVSIFHLLYVLGSKLWPKTMFERIMVILVGMFGSLTMLTAFTCVILMPVSDATVLMFTTPLFTMIFASIFLKERLTILKMICGNLILYHITLLNFHFLEKPYDFFYFQIRNL